MIRQSGDNASIIWADKAALGLALFCALLLGALWSMSFAIIGGNGAWHLWTRYGAMSIGLVALGLMASWLLFRAVDFLAGGSTYRLAAHHVQAMVAVLGKGTGRMARLAHPHRASVVH